VVAAQRAYKCLDLLWIDGRESLECLQDLAVCFPELDGVVGDPFLLQCFKDPLPDERQVLEGGIHGNLSIWLRR
jgi:hypothetical protein